MLILSFNRIGFLLYIWAVVQEFSILPPNAVVKIRIDKSNRGWPWLEPLPYFASA